MPNRKSLLQMETSRFANPASIHREPEVQRLGGGPLAVQTEVELEFWHFAQPIASGFLMCLSSLNPIAYSGFAHGTSP
jgi:hypothetical protein